MKVLSTRYIVKTSENEDGQPMGTILIMLADKPLPEGYSVLIGEKIVSDNIYVDYYGRYHDKPVDLIGTPSSNNGFYYTGLAKKYGLPIEERLTTYARLCAKKRVRHLDRDNPPISRDEVLGLVELGYVKELGIGPGNWSYSPYKLPLINPIKLVYHFILTAINYKDRNYFWVNKLDQMYRFAFSVPLSDRYYILRKMGKNSIFYKIIHKLDGLLMPESRSPRLVRHFKHWDDHDAVENYFGEKHVITKAVK